VWWQHDTHRGPAPTQREYATGQDERATIQLGDGSRVVLGPESRIRYAEPFGARDRDVYLQGKAYFAVANRQASPFVVYTPTSATQVLGTAFVVKAMPYDSVVQVMVESGKVAFRQSDSHAGSGTTLTHGELARLTPAGLMTVSHDVDVRAYSSWSLDRVQLTNATVAVVVRTIEERYGIQIILPPTVSPTTDISLGLDTETRDQAVQLLADVLDLTYTRTGRVVTLRPRH
jgi:ferric-dicitrate binding protein FerR (iron transport regulator)